MKKQKGAPKEYSVAQIIRESVAGIFAPAWMLNDLGYGILFWCSLLFLHVVHAEDNSVPPGAAFDAVSGGNDPCVADECGAANMAAEHLNADLPGVLTLDINVLTSDNVRQAGAQGAAEKRHQNY